jgi:RsiW-degrading membrane proteinase PrsW (M82 family)
MLIDLLMQTNPVLIQDKEYLVVALEELVKIIALIFGLEIADKRFNELSDGIVYAVFTALGFIFFENILYLLSGNLDIWSFVLVFLSRLIFSFGAHLSIILFGVTYAEAYLHTSPKLLKKLKQKNEARIKPYHFHRILKFLYDKYHIFIIFYLPLSPIILLFQLYEQKHPITMSELIFSGILGSIYLHIIYDLLLNINIPWLNTVVLSIFGIFALSIYHYFPKLEVH